MYKKNIIQAHAIWISDLHLGSCGTRIKELLDFLNALSCDTLFLNGDIIDKWLIKQPEKLSTRVEQVINKINQLHNQGVKVIFCTGNHDQKEDLCYYFPNIQIYDEFIYQALNGKKYLVFHGHSLDVFNSLKFKSLSKLGTLFYECLLFFRNNKRKNKNSLSRKVKIMIKKIIYRVFFYEKRLIRYLDKKEVQGVIYGHSHQLKHHYIKSKEYINSGDWIDSCSYVIESSSGQFIAQSI